MAALFSIYCLTRSSFNGQELSDGSPGPQTLHSRVLRRPEEFLRPLQTRKFNDDQPAFFRFAFESNDLASAHDELPAIARDDLRRRFGIFTVAIPVGYLDAR